jgi:hypothetical protein
MTEVGLPFFILFYKQGDDDIVSQYRDFVSNELSAERGKPNEKLFEVYKNLSMCTRLDDLQCTHKPACTYRACVVPDRRWQ